MMLLTLSSTCKTGSVTKHQGNEGVSIASFPNDVGGDDSAYRVLEAGKESLGNGGSGLNWGMTREARERRERDRFARHSVLLRGWLDSVLCGTRRGLY